MRAITGWRFLLVIVLPLALACLGAVGLTYDLLSRVESSGNRAENARNRVAVTEAFEAEARELGRLAAENARWEEAWRNTAGKVDIDWFNRTWGKTISIGSSYNIVAVTDLATGAIIAHNVYSGSEQVTVDRLTGIGVQALRSRLSETSESLGLATGFVQASFGPSVVAVAAISNPINGNAQNGRALIFVKVLTDRYLGLLEKRLTVTGLILRPPGLDVAGDIDLKGLAGTRALGVSWQDKALGMLVTEFAWQKAGIVLGFMIMVVTGIAFVCWRLVQQLLSSEEKAKRDSLHDHLTGLANRHALVETMRTVATVNKEPYALAFADLDGFKEVNDSYGHEFGDGLIRMVATGITQLAQGARTVARMGGDEFVILYAGDNAETRARQFSERVIKLLSQPFDMEGRLALVGASIGLATSSSEIDETEALRRADVAMYRAKADGKNRVCVFDESFDNERRETLSIAAELKRHLQARNLDIKFQPVVSAKSGKMTGVEALARWPSDSPRKISADRFITVAESSGLIDELGELILNKACDAARAWPTLRLAVNISTVQLNNPRFVERALSILATYGIAPNRVEFEITETSLIHDSERAQQVFKALQSVGVKVALDDFGTGFSSIGYLRRFSFDRIKIDKSIVSKVLSSPAELAVVQGTLLVARGLSAEVTAEGVEREDEVQVLRLAGCTELQGYHFHKPLEASEISRLISAGQSEPVVRARIVA